MTSFGFFKINEKFQPTDRGNDNEQHAASLWLVSPSGSGAIRAALERPDKCAPRLFMKSWERDGAAEYGNMMQELEILRAARDHSDYIVELVASHVSPKSIHIILEMASGTMHSRYFPAGALVLDGGAAVGSDAHLSFLKECCAPFFERALSFLHDVVARAYCDWKFENILCFDIGAAHPRLKLADFGAAQQLDKTIPNPKNFNQAYTPATLCAELETVTPCKDDDYACVSNLFVKLNGLQLPWEAVAATITEMTSLHYLTIALLKTSLFKFDSSKCLYWPDFLN